MNAPSGMEKDHPLNGFIGSYHTTGRPKTTVESYYETFGIRPTPSAARLETLGVEHLLKDDDKQRLKTISGQIRNYLEEITSENAQLSTDDGSLSGKVAS